MKRVEMTGAILAGGRSSRMGRDKALLRFGNATLVEHLVRIATSVFAETLVIVNDRSKLEGLALHGAQAYGDLEKDRGPMGGVCTALAYARFETCCVLTCDMPYVDQVLIRQFLCFWEPSYDALCVEDLSGFRHPFPGIYRVSMHGLLQGSLERGEASMKRSLDTARVKSLVLEEERVLYNMNTPEDYDRGLRERAEGER